MTIVPATGAASHDAQEWYAINWRQAQREVRRLQARIVKATQEGRWGKVNALQRLLTRSYSAKVLAVKRVTENEGKRTPGVDRVIWDTPQKKARAVTTLRQRGYRPQPLRRVYIDKDNGKKRPLGIPTMKDRAMQAIYLLALVPVAETTADLNSYGFRPERSIADAIEQCHKVLALRQSARWVLEGDITGCFDNISHEWLLAHIPIEKRILRQWLKAGYMEQGSFHATEAGTPQGGIISPVLANMALDGLERLLHQRYPPRTQADGQRPKVNVIRYADDFIVTGKTYDVLKHDITPLIKAFLRERGLELSPHKTRITHIDEGFDFLGQNLRRYPDGKVLTKPAKKNVKKFLAKVRGIIKANPQAPAGLLIARLNPVIRGWARQHRHAASSQTFVKVDHAIFQALWRWALRRHPKKGKRWVKKKYFKTIGDRNWVFSGEFQGKMRHLVWARDMPIRRLIKIKADANPFDPAWELYFEERLRYHMEQSPRRTRRVDWLWREQDGICPLCDQTITEATGWHVHHIIWRSLGGPDTLDNLVLLHPHCHRQVHHQRLHVEKPRPSRGG